MKRMRLTLVIAVLLGAACAASEAARVLAFGWVSFVLRTWPEARVNPEALATGALFLMLLAVAIEVLGRGWCRATSAGSTGAGTPPPAWRARWTLSIVVLVFLMFAAGYSTIGLARQVGWLLCCDRPLRLRQAGSGGRSEQRLKSIGVALANYHRVNHALPPGGTFGPCGQAHHGWATALLPYFEQARVAVDPNLPWNHPGNAPKFKTVLPELLNPELRAESLDAEGFGLAHYAANGRVIHANSSVPLGPIGDGASNVLAVGEVSRRFRPWGHPANLRDPALGIDASPDGFGGPATRNGAQFLMLDGSVRFLSRHTDPEVLRALSAPADVPAP